MFFRILVLKEERNSLFFLIRIKDKQSMSIFEKCVIWDLLFVVHVLASKAIFLYLSLSSGSLFYFLHFIL